MQNNLQKECYWLKMGTFKSSAWLETNIDTVQTSSSMLSELHFFSKPKYITMSPKLIPVYI